MVGGIQGSGAEALDAGEVVVGRPDPAEGFGIVVDGVDVPVDGGFKVAEGAMDAAADLFVGQLGEEPLDLVEPGGGGRGEMDVPVRPPGEPGADRRRLVRGVIVHHEMHVEIARHLGVDRTQELEELSGAMALVTTADDLAGRHVERGEQRARTVPLVVVAASLGLAGTQGQQRLRPVERLDLFPLRADHQRRPWEPGKLLVHAQHQRAVGRRQIEPDDVANLVHEERVGRQLEGIPAEIGQIGR